MSYLQYINFLFNILFCITSSLLSYFIVILFVNKLKCNRKQARHFRCAYNICYFVAWMTAYCIVTLTNVNKLT